MHRTLCFAALACASLTASLTAQSRALGYAVDSDAANHLWAIDLSSGNAADLGPTGRTDIEALAFHPDGRLFGIEDGEEADLLVLLDLRSGAATVVGSLGAPVANPGLAIDATGAAWVASDGIATGERPLYALDLASGRATLVGDLGQDIQGLMAAGRSIYGINDEGPGLFRIDTRRGTAELLATLGAPFQGECPSLEIAPNGDWLALNDAGAIFLVDPASGSAAQSSSTRSGFESLAIPQNQVCAYAVDSDNADQLHAIDLRTGASVAIGSVGFTDIEGLAFSSEGRLFGIDDDGTPELIELDLSSGNGRSIGALGVAISNPGFAIDESGAGYVISDSSTGPLHRIDLATGAATFVGNSAISGVGLAFLRGELFSLDWDPDQLARLDPLNANPTVVGALQNLNLACGGLDATSDGTLWGLDDLGRILLVSPTSGTALHVASTLPGCEGLAIPPGCGAGPFDARCLELDFELPLPTVAALGGPAQTIELELELPFATLPENLAGLGVELFANGLAISPIMVLDEKGRSRSEAGAALAFEVALSAKKRTLSASLSAQGYRAILGLPTAAGSGSSIVELRARVLLPIDGLPGPLFARCRVPFEWGEPRGRRDHRRLRAEGLGSGLHRLRTHDQGASAAGRRHARSQPASDLAPERRRLSLPGAGDARRGARSPRRARAHRRRRADHDSGECDRAQGSRREGEVEPQPLGRHRPSLEALLQREEGELLASGKRARRHGHPVGAIDRFRGGWTACASTRGRDRSAHRGRLAELPLRRGAHPEGREWNELEVGSGEGASSARALGAAEQRAGGLAAGSRPLG
ncbi:MAG: hypothetical protein IPN34_21815 [Planctomycetes bacterium]|nr:hypothetical protein [Planctomycetota bacterium]